MYYKCIVPNKYNTHRVYSLYRCYSNVYGYKIFLNLFYYRMYCMYKRGLSVRPVYPNNIGCSVRRFKSLLRGFNIYRVFMLIDIYNRLYACYRGYFRGLS